MKEDLSCWERCFGCKVGFVWKQHKPNKITYNTYIMKQCVLCVYRHTKERYLKQFNLDLHNKIHVKNKWIRDTEDRTLERLEHSFEFIRMTLDPSTILEVYKIVFEEHTNKISRLWVRSLQRELLSRQ